MGSSCSTTQSVNAPLGSAVDASLGEHSLSSGLSQLPNTFTIVHLSHASFACGCLVRNTMRRLAFVVTDGEKVWGKEVDMNYLQQIKESIENGHPFSPEQFFNSFKSSFQQSKLSLDINTASSRSHTPSHISFSDETLDSVPDDSSCRMNIELHHVPVIGRTTVRLNLALWGDVDKHSATQAVESTHAIIGQYFLVPLYEYYSVRTETMPRQRIEDLQKQLELYRSELGYLEQQSMRKASKRSLNTGGSSGALPASQLTQHAGHTSTKPNGKKSSGGARKSDSPRLQSQAQVAKFLTTLKKRLIQNNVINEQEHEALTAVINNLNQDTIYRYELNKNQEKKVDMEVMAWIKDRFKPESNQTRQKRDLATVDANSFIKNIDVSNIERTKTRQDIISMFDKVNDWNFDVFKLRDLTDGQTLFITSYTLFVKYDLLRKFNIAENVLIGFLREIQGGYHMNPYHNSMHAADVLQVFHFIVAKGGLGNFLSDEDILAGLISAIIHDYDHPGLNNAFQISTQSYLATLYNDRAVLENHHCAQAFELMRTKEYNILENLSKEQYSEVRETIIDMVLATDMGQHAKIVGKFKNLIEHDSDFSEKKDVRVALEVAIKIADVSNPIRPHKLYFKWAKRISEEFYNQGDKERDLNLEISPFMDRTKPSLASLQTAFIVYLVTPMIESYCAFLPKMDFCRQYVSKNQQYWHSNIDVPADLDDDDGD